MATATELAEQLAALTARLKHRAEHSEAQIEPAHAIVRSMGNAGLLQGSVILGPTFSGPYRPESQTDDTCQIVQAALLVPEGFGVCYWETEEYNQLSASSGGSEAEARLQFHPFASCSAAEKAFLARCAEEMLEDLHDAALAEASRIESGVDVSVAEYFGRRDDDAGEHAL